MSKPKTIQEITDKWHEVARAGKFDHHQGRRMALDQCRQYLQSLSKSLDMERARLRYLAQRLSDHFWAHNEAHRTKETRGSPGHHGCQVRMLHGSLEMHWYYNTFVRVKNGKGHAVFSEHIRRLVRANLKQLASLEAHFDGLQPRNPRQKPFRPVPFRRALCTCFSIWKGAETFTCKSSIGRIKMIA